MGLFIEILAPTSCRQLFNFHPSKIPQKLIYLVNEKSEKSISPLRRKVTNAIVVPVKIESQKQLLNIVLHIPTSQTPRCQPIVGFNNECVIIGGN